MEGWGANAGTANRMELHKHLLSTMAPSMIHHSKSTPIKSAKGAVDIGPAESANSMFVASSYVLFWTPPKSRILHNSNVHFLNPPPLGAASTMETDLQQYDRDAGLRLFQEIRTHNSTKGPPKSMSITELAKSTESISTNIIISQPQTNELLGYTSSGI